MSDRIKLNEEELDLVSGGDITYTWKDGKGTIGLNGYNPFILVNKQAYLDYYNSVKGTLTDGQILTNLLAMGIAQKP